MAYRVEVVGALEHETGGQPSSGQSFLARWLLWITTPLILAALLAAWKAYVVLTDVSVLILPPPEQVAAATVRLLSSPFFYEHLSITLYETLVGFALGCLAGITFGVVLGKLRALERILSPFIVATQVIPKVAVVPLFILWFGFGPNSKIFMAALLSFFPLMQNTILGIRSIDRGHQDLMTVVQASRWQRLWLLEIPSSLPYVLTGIELAIVFAITGAVVGEYLGGDRGLGALAVITLAALRTDALFATVFILTVLGFLLYAVVAASRRFVIPWHESSGVSD
ncbi:MAG: ABC transporter permease [Chloroflexi bacterium]|jgi:NitT/TauT family transport system permease protein|nr:ABC transporter permease [Chloroflexota bacterium]